MRQKKGGILSDLDPKITEDGIYIKSDEGPKDQLNENLIKLEKNKIFSFDINKYFHFSSWLEKDSINNEGDDLINIEIDKNNKVILIEQNVFDYGSLDLYDVTKTQNGYKKKLYPKSKVKELVKKTIDSHMIHSSFLMAMIIENSSYETIAINIITKWIDQGTGKEKKGVIASMSSKKDILMDLNLENLDPSECVKMLKGISTPSFNNLTPIRPIFSYNKDDDRFIDSIDVDQNLAESTNLAAMDWEEFEHLVAQLFEWEFKDKGMEVKVTRSSRDRGVDAIVFDPDPIRGGKFVIQAKRYTNTVELSAVRDLYGTVVNEGANRGILITTAGYGPDAYEFSKDKPISLIDGPNLLNMFMRHGKNYKIDIEEAKAQLNDTYIQ